MFLPLVRLFYFKTFFYFLFKGTQLYSGTAGILAASQLHGPGLSPELSVSVHVLSMFAWGSSAFSAFLPFLKIKTCQYVDWLC